MSSNFFTTRQQPFFLQNAVDINTTGAWDFNGDGQDRTFGGNVSVQQGFQALYGIRETRRQALFSGGTGGTTGNTTKTSGPVTVACWFNPRGVVTANRAIIGYRQAGGSGNPNTHNFPFTLDFQTANKYRFIWQNANKVDNIVQGLTTLQLGEWYHIIGTRPTGGLTGEVYLNGVLDSDAPLTDPHDGGGSQNTLSILGVITGGLSQAIVKSVHVDAAEALALYQETAGSTAWRP